MILSLIKVPIDWLLSWLATPRAARVVGEPFFWLTGMRRKGQKIDLSQVKRVLVVRLDEIGDVVLTTPFLRELRRNLPNAWVTLVVKPQVYNLVELCPYVNEVLTYDWGEKGRSGELRRHVGAIKLAAQHLWKRKFDLAVLPRWDADHYYHGTFLVYFSGAPWRVGYSEGVISHKRRLNGGYDRLFTHVLNDSTVKHEVEHNLDVIRFLGGQVQDERLELWLSEEDETFTEQMLKSHGVGPDNLLIAFAPGAGVPKRMWPLGNFIELGTWLKSQYAAHLVVGGGRGEERLGRELQQKIGDTVINAVAQTTLRQTSALLKRCHLYVGNDAGPMHLAAAAGIPVVEISCHPLDGSPSHPNSPVRFGPWGVPHIVLQPEKAIAPCSKACNATQAHCILSITVGQVKEAIMPLLSQSRPVLQRWVSKHAD